MLKQLAVKQDVHQPYSPQGGDTGCCCWASSSERSGSWISCSSEKTFSGPPQSHFLILRDQKHPEILIRVHCQRQKSRKPAHPSATLGTEVNLAFQPPRQQFRVLLRKRQARLYTTANVTKFSPFNWTSTGPKKHNTENSSCQTITPPASQSLVLSFLSSLTSALDVERCAWF